jgi:hypothetical protein
VLHDLLLELAHVLLESVQHGAQLGVLALEVFDFVLEAGDALELAAAALGGGHAVALPLALQLDALLALHVDRGHARRVAAHRRHRLRLVLDADAEQAWRHAGVVVAADGRRGAARHAAAAARRLETAAAHSVTRRRRQNLDFCCVREGGKNGCKFIDHSSLLLNLNLIVYFKKSCLENEEVGFGNPLNFNSYRID